MKTRHAWTLLFSLLLSACGNNSTVSTPDAAVQDSQTPTLSTQAQPATAGNTEKPDPTAKHGKHGKPDTITPKLPYKTDPAEVRKQKLPVLTPPKDKAPKSTGATGVQTQSLQTLALGDKANVVALRVLVIGTGSSDDGLEMAKAMLGQQGIPYDVLDATTTNLTEGTLVAADGSGKYQGVILTTGGLAYQPSPGVWDSALTWDEWNLLWNYEKTYAVRQLALYTYPGTYPEDYGIRNAGRESDGNQAQVTAAGQQVFPDLKTGVNIPVNYAWNYPSTTATVTGLTTTPLLTDSGGAVLGVQSNTSDGRERVALTMAHNPYLLHSQLFSYGLLNWLTKGVYLGEYRRYLQVDVDDWFLADDLWKPTSNSTGSVEGEYRITASDALAARDQQTALRQKYPVASAFKFAIAFNAGGANTSAPNTCAPAATSVDPLTSVSRCMYNTFDWFNHSRDHLSMDFVTTYNQAYQQWQGNQNRASTLGLTYHPSVAVSGEHSGLGWYNKDGLDYNKTDYGLAASNQFFLDAACGASIRYLGSNRGVASQYDPSCPNSCGVQHPKKNLFLVPRWPTNIFYYASTPDEVVSSYNAMYGPAGVTPFFDHNFTYAEILTKETEIALNHVLAGSMFPHYLHQTNFKQYAPGKSLVFDWADSVLNSYSQYTTLPLRTLLWKDLGPYVKQRTTFVKTNVRGTWDRTANSITLTSPTAVTAFVTGTRAGTSETYGPTVISRVTLAANTPATFPIQK